MGRIGEILEYIKLDIDNLTGVGIKFYKNQG